MSNVKRDLMKEIEAKVAKKKLLAQQVSRQKTVAQWVADFFKEFETTRKIEEGDFWRPLAHLALNRLNIQLRSIDRHCSVNFAEGDEDGTPLVEIHWSADFIQKNNCEAVLVFDASSAFFQSALEDI